VKSSVSSEKELVAEAKPTGVKLPVVGTVPKQVAWVGAFAILLTLAFFKPLYANVQYALKTDLHSHAILIPFVSGYLIWLMRGRALPPIASSAALGVLPLALGLVGLKFILFPTAEVLAAKPQDYLALATFSYLCLLWAGALTLLGWRFMREYLFPAAFLIFIVPMPTMMENGLEYFFQHTSADAFAVIADLGALSYYRDGLDFKLSTITLRVAQECSGIRSSYVLFITSLLAGHMFLQSPQRRLVLALFVIPLGIIRNGLRIYTIGMLCVHVGPHMIDSIVHTRGGPMFFALSLIPFFLFLLWLRRGEVRMLKRLAAAENKSSTTS
jgi:exosortase C (VPDSG-CTERM-specific)